MELVDTITSDLGQPRRSGQNLFWCCPFHDDREPSLTITPDGRHWKCFGCDQSGDVIDWLMERQGISFAEAKGQMGNLDSPAPDKQPSSKAYNSRPSTTTPEWQRQAQHVVEECTPELFRSAGENTRRWLENRGLKSDTLRQWQIGFNPQPRKLHGLWVERGITIPWYQSGNIKAINVRRVDPDSKYKMVTGSHRRGLYLGETIRAGRPTLLTEGEFDALLGWQEAGDLVNVATLGSSGTRPDADAVRLLLGSPVIFLAYDTDEAGAKAIENWLKLTRRVTCLDFPKGADLTEFSQAEGDIKALVLAQLESLGVLQTQHTNCKSANS